MKARGMTLLEVMVALAVFAVAGLSVMKSASEHLSGLSWLQEKTLATWVADNQLVQLRLEKKWPGDSWVEGESELAGQKWYWRYRGQATQDASLRLVEVEVRDTPKGENPITLLRTYINR
ncbi:type II secretion system minor pseudopilin GspI [Aeromonas schubertii]|uniref:Type II secretion system protein I n=1 Tax=Aeromonas schubertii TaxID=652 RepID=A0A0S2SIH3_9GAMM|nr:type II secretion system minor pseudopilin GspI [Aeromonas schubertii]ALP41503.1 general secretion pathway protein I [Aeromonas schubertii]MBZ6064827.1 type II secretion system minor pseudopilin GspI [Aeromonas schubertii]MBZ6074516.1 type II secretion system minor pseudopilin GspI [Aeromonas schubertii]